MIGIMIRDPIDRSLPKGVSKVFIEDTAAGKKFLFNVHKYKEEYERKSKMQEIELKNILESVKGDFLLLDTSEKYLDKLIKFLERRKRKFH